MRETYEKPQILRHDATLANHFGAGPARRVVDRIDGVSVAKLLQAHGSPLFVFSERDLRAKAKAMREAFRSRWPRTLFAWSYKTNHLDAICSLFHQEGWAAEVVSAAEYHMARRLGMPGESIIFNGACKPVESLRTAVDDGALIQLDGFDELERLEEIAAASPGRYPVAIRVNMVVEALGMSWDRFGFNLDRGEVADAARRLARSKHLELVGLHCHIGTYIHQPEAYREAARRLIAAGLDLEKHTGCNIRIYNMGGGFPSHSTLHGQYGSGEDAIAPLDQFAEAITGAFNATFKLRKDKDKPILALESGRALVDEAGTLLATVMGTRRVPDGRRGLVLDAGVNLLYTSSWYRHDVAPAERVPGQLEDTALYGPLCMAIDVVRASVLLPPIGPGQAVALAPVGAYNVTQWMQFSQMRPAVVMVRQTGAVEVIRDAESVNYLKEVEHLPDDLRSTTAPPSVLAEAGAAPIRRRPSRTG